MSRGSCFSIAGSFSQTWFVFNDHRASALDKADVCDRNRMLEGNPKHLPREARALRLTRSTPSLASISGKPCHGSSSSNFQISHPVNPLLWFQPAEKHTDLASQLSPHDPLLA